ncbi:MAG TPA: response regulator [Vicinamibacterales bacterium]|jgi:DNA-binding response OmpR family regulator|nr:response regulator [Vicinamibacterales bacterium]
MTRDRRAVPLRLPTVLVVDDDADARRMYSEYLRSRGWTAFTASDGRTGLDKVGDLTPDCVIVDLAMPRVDGWTVMSRLRESSWTSRIPIVVISARIDARDEAFRAGADAYLSKPCPPDVLWLQICALLNPELSDTMDGLRVRP